MVAMIVVVAIVIYAKRCEVRENECISNPVILGISNKPASLIETIQACRESQGYLCRLFSAANLPALLLVFIGIGGIWAAIRTLNVIERQANLMEAQFDQWVDLTQWRIGNQPRNDSLRVLVNLVNPTQFPITLNGEVTVGNKKRLFDNESLFPKRPKTIEFIVEVCASEQAAGSASFPVTASLTHLHRISHKPVTRAWLGRLDCVKWSKVDRKWHATYVE
jgi:hypothetical protein